MMGPEPIAVIGSACRFAGGINTPSKLWDLLNNPRDVQSQIPSSRFNPTGFFKGSTVVDKAYLLSEDPSVFDHAFFGIRAQEAEAMDPQQRMLLEVVYEGLESAGYTIQGLQGSSTAVYVGQINTDYYDIMTRDMDNVPEYMATSTARSITSNRVSYVFDWTGPSVTIDTACSSSLVAVQQAAQILRSGESTMAIAAGTNLLLSPEQFSFESKLRMLSPRGRCSMWDIEADGYARGEGIAVVLLKTLSRALEDGDSIECLIREVKVNQDGRTMGITMPSATSQAELIRSTYASCGLNPASESERCHYFEAHGTGTPAGDPVEAHAVQTVFFPQDQVEQNGSLFVGSIKTLIGHTEGTAGLVGLLKASLAVQHGVIPANFGFNRFSPAVEPYCQHLKIPMTSTPWPDHPEGTPRRVSVNSFGFGGTNSHAIIESWHDKSHIGHTNLENTSFNLPYGPAVISANSPRSLVAAVSSIAEFVKRREDIGLVDILWTLQTKRSEHRFKVSFSATNRNMLIRKLAEWVTINANNPTIRPARLIAPDSPVAVPSIFAVFTGQGAQWPRMGARLLETSRIFLETISSLDNVLATLPDPPSWSLRTELEASAELTHVHQAVIAQPLCTAVQIALVDFLLAIRTPITKIVGHSSGEIAAAYAAGYLTAADAIRVSYYRGLCVGRTTSIQGLGGMLAAELSFLDAVAFCREPQFRGKLMVAASNAPASVTLSGNTEAVQDAINVLTVERGVFARRLRVDTAYHSHQMQECASDYADCLDRCVIDVKIPRSGCTWYSSVNDGGVVDPSKLDCTYWVENLTKPVLFSQALKAAFSVDNHSPSSRKTAVGIEIGPHAVLKKPVLETLASLGIDVEYSGVLKRNEDDMEVFTEALGFLWKQFSPAKSVVDFAGFREACLERTCHPSKMDNFRVCKEIPSYPWDHETSLWRESRLSRQFRLRGASHPLLGTSTDLGSSLSHRKEAHWRNIMRLEDLAWLRGHQFQNQVLFPASGYVSMAVDACLALADSQAVWLLELENANLHRPIVLEDNTNGVEILSTIRVLSQEKDHVTAEFMCSSLPVNNSLAVEQDVVLENFTCHAKLLLETPDSDTGHTALPEPTLHQGLLSSVDVDAFYSSVAKAGLQYTGKFRARNIERGSANVSVVHFDRSHAEMIHLHPATLDVASHGIFCALPSPAKEQGIPAVYLPKSIDRVRVDIRHMRKREAAGVPQEATSHMGALFSDCYLRDFNSDIRCDVEIFCEQDNHPEVQIEGLTCSRFGSSPDEAMDRILCSRTEWKRDLSSNGTVGISGGDSQDHDEELWTTTDIANRAAYFFLRRLRDQLLECSKSKTPISIEPQLQLWTDWAVQTALPLIESTGPGTSSIEEWSHDTYDEVLEWQARHPESTHLSAIIALGNTVPQLVCGSLSLPELLDRDEIRTLLRQNTEAGLARATHLLVEAVSQVTHRYPHMDIIEIGAGTGTVAEVVLEKLNDLNSISYTLTDPSAARLTKARTQLSKDARAIFQQLDLEYDPAAQGFQEGTYGIVIVAMDISSVVTNLDTTLGNLRRLLRPGGFLILQARINKEGISSQFIRVMTQKTVAQSRHIRTTMFEPPSEADWHTVLLNAQFSGVDSVAKSVDSNESCYSYSCMTSQAIDGRITILRDPTSHLLLPHIIPEAPKLLPDIVIIGANSLLITKTAYTLKTALQPFASAITLISDFDKASQTVAVGTHVICLAELHESIFQGMTTPRFKTLQNIMCNASQLMWLTTRRNGADPYSNMVVGIARSVMIESPDRPMLFVHTENGIPDARWLADSFLRMSLLNRAEFKHGNLLWSSETELAIDSSDCILIPRIVPDTSTNDRLNSRHRPKLKLAQPIDTQLCLVSPEHSLGYTVWQRPELLPQASASDDPSCLNIVVRYSSIFPLVVQDRSSPHFLVVGVEDHTGRHVLALSPENCSRVTILAEDALNVNQYPVHELPSLLNDLQRCVLAQSITQNAEGNIWIHGADVRLSHMIRVAARQMGLEVFFSTSDKTSQASGTTFVHPQVTARGLQAIAPHDVQTFVDLSDGRSNLAHINGPIRAILHGAARFHQFPTHDHRGRSVIRLENSHSQVHATIRKHLAGVSSTPLVDQDTITCSLSLLEILGNQRHFDLFGVMDWISSDPIPAHISMIDGKKLLSMSKTYLLAGLTGDVGLSLCEWMAGNGARYFVLGSRNPVVPRDLLTQLEGKGVHIKVLSLDISDIESVKAAHRTIKTSGMPEVGGVANGAMVLRDKVFENMSLDEFLAVLAPKVQGTINLDLVFGHGLDFFVLFSSLSSVIGIPGLANYGAANAFMHTFAQQRRRRGLCASVLDISILTEQGYVAHSDKHDAMAMTRRHNTLPLSEADLHFLFAEAVCAGSRSLERDAQITTGIGFWSTSNRGSSVDKQDLMPGWYKQPRLSHYLSFREAKHQALQSQSNAETSDEAATESLRKQLETSQHVSEALATLTKHVVRKVEQMLQMPTESLNDQMPLLSLGADSLVATQLQSWVAGELDVKLPALKILASASVGALCKDILATMIDLPCNRQGETLNSQNGEPLDARLGGFPDQLALSVDRSSPMDAPTPVAIHGNATEEMTNILKIRDCEPITPDECCLNDNTDSGSEGTMKEVRHVRTGQMSDGQSRLYMLHRYLDDKSTHNCGIVGKIHGEFVLERFCDALKKLSDEHEALRSCFFVQDASGQCLQAVMDSTIIAVDHEMVNKKAMDDNALRRFQDGRGHIFDIEHGQTMKVLVLSHTPQDHDIMIIYHHIIMDGISLVTFLRDLSANYSGSALGAVPLQSIELSTRQRDHNSLAVQQADIRYWKDVFSATPPVLQLFPFSKTRNRPLLDHYSSHKFEIKLDSSFVRRVRSKCNGIGATNFHFYVTALATFLTQWLDVTDFSIGFVDANRPGVINPGEADDSETIGYFLNMLALRMRVDQDVTFDDLVVQVRDLTFAALAHSTTPFQTVLDELRVPRNATHHPLFQAAINYRMGHPSARSSLGDDATIEWTETIVARSPFDLHIDLTEFREGGVWVSVFLQASLYEQSDTSLLARSFVHLLQRLSDSKSDRIKVRDFPVAGNAETQQTVELGHGLALPLSPWPATLLQRVDDISASYPAQIAIKECGISSESSGGQLTYLEVVRRSIEIANRLSEHGIIQGSFVCVYMAPTAESICTTLAIFRIGAIFVPLDMANPPQRLQLIVEESRPRVIVSHGSHSETAKNLCSIAPNDCELLDLDSLDRSTSTANITSPPHMQESGLPACVLYTSGSTGRPKGVVLTHGNLLSQIHACASTMDIGRETVLQQSPLGFDPSLEQIFGGLAHGGTVIVVLESARRDPVAVANIMAREGVTYTVAVPTEYASLLRYGAPVLTQCKRWRLAVSGGERLTARILTQFRSLNLPGLRLINAYGPTEATVSCTRGMIDYRSTTGDAHVGRTLPNYLVLIVDPRTGKVAPVGFPGEVYIGGSGVASGYLRRSSETLARFLPSSVLGDNVRVPVPRLYRTGDMGRILEDGTLHLLGRNEGDSQVKLRGVRIELEEVARVMEKSAGSAISDLALSLRGHETLIAFVVFSKDFEGERSVFLDQLVGGLPLPTYMRPTMAISLNDLPVTPNGKRDQRAIDSLALQSGPNESFTSVAGIDGAGSDHEDLTSLELCIKEAWEEVLPNDRVSVIRRKSDFFHAGGNSLLLLRLQSVLETMLGARPTLPQLFQASTLGGMARAVGSQTQTGEHRSSLSSTMNWENEIAALADQLDCHAPGLPVTSAQRPGDQTSMRFKATKRVSVLLTGATGFVGTSILQSLVEHPTIHEIHCVAIRPDHKGRPRHITRVRECGVGDSKIREYQGDLGAQYLGLSRSDFSRLAATVDVIIHNGADVSLLKSYASLRRPNVLSSRAILQMVMEVSSDRCIPIHFVSTASVACFAQQTRAASAPKAPGFEIGPLLKQALPPVSVSMHPPTPEDAIVQGYRCSKWASEALLERAVMENPTAGLSVVIHRPTSILGEGASDTDALGSIVRVSTQLRAAPKLDATVDGVLDLIDVEDVAKGVVTSAIDSTMAGTKSPVSSTIRFLHHCSSQKMHTAHLGRYLSKRLGCDIKECEQAEWLQMARSQDIGPLMHSFLSEWEKRDEYKILFPVVTSE